MADVGDKAVASGGQGDGPPRAVLFELETVAVPGRQVLFDVTKAALASKDIDLSAALFARYCLDAGGGAFPGNILAVSGKSRVSDTKLLDEINGAVAKQLVNRDLSPPAQFTKLLEQVREKGVRVGALGLFGDETATQCVEAFGFAEQCDRAVGCRGGICHTFTDETWTDVARALKVSPSLCVAVASTARSSHAALTAGMSIVVVPDTYTEYQDFGGADHVSPGGFDAAAVAAVHELLERD